MPFCVGGVEPQKIEPVGVILQAFLLQFFTPLGARCCMMTLPSIAEDYL